MYYKAPLQIQEETLSIRPDIESMRTSIDSFLELLVFTPKGGFKPDADFGFEFWSNEFQNFVIKNFNNRISDANLVNSRGEYTNKDACEKNLKQSIEQYEQRLKKVQVDLAVEQNDTLKRAEAVNVNEIKYEVRLIISGELSIDNLTTEKYKKEIRFFVAPIIRK